MRKQRRGFRLLFYFKTGYATYLILVMGAINVLTSTYFLAVDDIPFVKELFPTFEMYVMVAVIVAVPAVTITGYVHYKRIGAFSANASVATQNNIFNYKFRPGFELEVFGPAYKLILVLTFKRIRTEKFTDEEIKEIDRLRKQLKHLIDGGSVGTYAKGVIDD